ncbi:amidohydrolase family protein [Noviherbaspirillum sedimenti]|uniref:Amidohydrolase n=1 Tax=Noviherbaspirillum sedimenti TaxID=2320865 RepID=A0A3A3GLU5_9BURK|nr:amidohydrolase family protein [Noviherbaspirillum sedimenti]RJG03256.1 amidohydrolase [Noviherbaspirillum sedimenti]
MSKVPPYGKVKEGREEEILDPEIAILDSHHHLFDRPHLRYMQEDYQDDVNAGHKIIGTVYIETQAFARVDGPEELRPVGEVEFANGLANKMTSGVYGPCRVAAAIVGYADMTTGDRVAATLDASIAAAPQRFRGIRQIAIAHPDENALRFLTHRPPPDLLKSPAFRAAYRHLAPRGLSFDATVLHHQLPELAQLADDFPDTLIVLNHAGLAMAMDSGPQAREEGFQLWRRNMKELARRPNVVCKVGGFGTSYWGFGFNERTDPIGFRELSAAWRPYVETAIEAFGANRCMMESNYPNDGRSCGFVPLWNAMKYIVQSYSAEEKTALFRGTAEKFYRVDLSLAETVHEKTRA